MADDLRDGNLADEKVADLLAAELPPEIRIAVSVALRPLLIKAARRERGRCVALVQAAASGHEAQARSANERAAAQAATGQPVTALFEQLALEAHGARVLAAMARVVQLPPGLCALCRGLRQVASGIAGADGRPALTACPSCSSSPAPVAELPPAG